jgi:hypothetical protein
MTHTKETIGKELKRIQASVPQMFKDFLFTEKEKTPMVKTIFEKALESDISEEKKEQVRVILRDGMLDQKITVENHKVAKQRDIWVHKEIKKSVKEGRLPNRKQLKELKIEHYGY